MAVGFRRTLSTMKSPKSVAPSFLLDCARPKKLSYARVRSTSLPVRLHPLAAALHDSSRALLSWADAPAQTGPAWVADGAGRAGRVLAGLADLLHHPQARDALRRPWTEQLLDDLLLLADLHGCFRESLVALGQLLAETHAALRRRDGARLAAALRAQRRAAREVSRLAASARDLSHRAAPDGESDEATLADAFAAATAAVAAASAAVFSGVSSLSIAASAARVEVETATPCWMPSPARFATPSATPRTTHHVITTRSSSMPRIWWVADLMRWMSRAKRRSAKKQHAEDHCSTSGAQSQAHATVVAMDPEDKEREVAFERLDNLERCIADVESSGEKVFRALVNTRVSLLNILSPAF